MNNASSRPTTLQERIERLPEVLESYANDVRRTNRIPDSGLGEILSFAATVVRNLRAEVSVQSFQATKAYQETGLLSEQHRNDLLYMENQTLTSQLKKLEEEKAELIKLVPLCQLVCDKELRYLGTVGQMYSEEVGAALVQIRDAIRSIPTEEKP